MYCVIIINCLNVASTPLSYINTRSIHTSEERLQQLIQTISSVKQYLTNNIVLLEVSELTDSQKSVIESLNVNYINYASDPVIARQRDSPFKGPTELRAMKKFLDSDNDISKYDYIFKLSGRYQINDKFNIENVDKTKYYIYNGGRPNFMSTVLYGVPSSLLENYKKALESNFYMSTSIENALIKCLDTKSIKFTPVLGVQGTVSVSTDFYNV